LLRPAETGRLNEVVNGLAPLEHRPKLGVIPVGTTNDFARALGIPREDILKAVDTILEGEARPIDIGRVNGQYFINIAGGGRLTELTYDVPSKLKTMLGQLAYYLKGMEMLLPSLRPTEVEIEYDGKLFEGEVMLFFVMLTNSVGGFEKLAPDSSLNDGMFDLVILKRTNLAEFIRLVGLALRGEHINDEHIHLYESEPRQSECQRKMLLNLDGEYGGELPGEFENLYRHITSSCQKKKRENWMIELGLKSVAKFFL
jgi:diacylglycerol kinase (ATP)